VVEPSDELVCQVPERCFVPVAGGSPSVVVRAGAGADGDGAVGPSPAGVDRAAVAAAAAQHACILPEARVTGAVPA